MIPGLLGILALGLQAQVFQPEMPVPPEGSQLSPNPNLPVKPARPGAPDEAHVIIRSVTQEADGPIRHLRGMVHIETSDMLLTSDELDYNSDTGDVQARGHVHFEQFARNEKIDCERADYNIDSETGKFYTVSGTAMPRINVRPGLLVTKNPFYFESVRADRMADHYILYDGFITDCILPRPWWRLKAPRFDVYPGDHAVAHRAWFKLKNIPLFYAPYYYKALDKEPRKSGFLIPNIGNSSLRGPVLGLGYYWAINRSYDLTYRVEDFFEAGLAHHIDFRGWVNQNTTFNFYLDGIKDTRGLNPDPSGALIVIDAKSKLGHGWEARGELNYLTSFAFREYYTESFNEAVYSETHSVGFVDKHWSDFGVYFVAQREVNFQSTNPGDEISIRKLPEAEFIERDHQLNFLGQPFWFSLDSTAGMLHRTEPEFQTRQFVGRVDFAPHLTTAFKFLGMSFTPSFGIRETEYESSVAPTGNITGQNVLRSSRDFTGDLLLPTFQRVFDAPKWIGVKMKHVIEPRITYKDVSGIGNFNQIVRFDQTDILSNTNQVEFSLTNRLLAKDKNGTVTDFLSWQVWWDRYFDPSFGGAVIPGQRNVLQTAVDLTGYAFLDGYRHSSPVVSAIRLQSRVNMEWRLDYDPVIGHIVNSSISLDGRIKQFFWSFGHTDLNTNPVLAPKANQLRGTIGYGSDQRRGWSAGFSAYYDYIQGILQYTQTQVTYNTDCCGLSVQYRLFDLVSLTPGATRHENQFRVAFSIANIGSFGTLQRQQRIF